MISEEEVKDWQQLPMPSGVLTSPHFGAWLYYRDKRRIERMKTDIIQDIINHLFQFNFDTKRDLDICIDVLKDQLKEQKNDNQ